MALGDVFGSIDEITETRDNKRVKEQGGVDLPGILGKVGRKEAVPPISIDHVEAERPVFRASGFARLCMRQEALCAMYKVPRQSKFNARQIMIFDVGHYVHDMIREQYLAPAQVLFGQTWKCKTCGKQYGASDGPYIKSPDECEVSDDEIFVYGESYLQSKEYLIGGHVDGFIGTNAPDSILEIKTSNDDYFKRNLQYEPAPQHTLQMQIYMWLSGFQKGYLLYFDKDTSEIKIFVVPYNITVIDQVRRSIDEFKASIKSFSGGGTKLPKRVVCGSPSDKMARECPVVEKCFEKMMK